MPNNQSHSLKACSKILNCDTNPADLPANEREVYRACLAKPQTIEQIALATNQPVSEVWRLLHFLNTRNLMTKSVGFVGDRAELRYLSKST